MLALGLAACVDETFGPGNQTPGTVQVALTLPPATPAIWSPTGETLHVQVRRAGQVTPVLDTSVVIGATLGLSLVVPLEQSVEQFVATAEVRYGPLLMFLGFDAVLLHAGEDTSITMQAEYVGPGARAASYGLGARDSTLQAGDTASLTPAVLDSAGQTIPNVPVRYLVTGPAQVTVDSVGVLTAASSGPADTARVTGWLPMGLTSGLVVRVAPNILPPPAGTRSWVGGTAGAETSWFAANNWLPAGVPVAGDTVVIDDAGSDPVLAGVDTVAALRITGYLELDSATLIVTGDLATGGPLGGFLMKHASDTVRVLGNATFAGQMTEGLELDDGVLEVAGDFSQPGQDAGFRARGNHRTVLNGTGPQRLSMAGASNGSQFRHLDIANNGGRILIGGEQELHVTGKMRVLTPVTIDDGNGGNGDANLEVEDSLTMVAGSRLTVFELSLGGGMAIAGAFAPQAGGAFRVRFQGDDQAVQAGLDYRDVEVNDDAYLTGPTTFDGFLSVIGSLTLGGHSLTVTSLRLENGIGTLVMQSPADLLDVRGDAEFEGDTIPGLLTNGVLRVGGNFYQRRYSNLRGTFRASGNHRTVLNGTGPQQILIQDTETTFGHLDVASTGATVGVLADRLNIAGSFRVTTPAAVLETGSEPTVLADIGDSLVTVAGSSLTLAGVVVRGGVSVLGTFDVSSIEFAGTNQTIPPGLAYRSVAVSGSATLAGTTTIAEWMWVHGPQSNLTLGGRKLVAARLSTGDGAGIGGDGTITMQNPADSIVLADFASFSGAAAPGSMMAGVLIVGGDVYQTSSSTAFQPSGSHRTILNGSANQVIQFDNPGASGAASWFQNLEFANTSGGIHIRNSVHVNGMLTATTPHPITAPVSGLVLSAAGVDLAGLDLDGIAFAIGAGTIARFDSVTFRNQSPAATQLTIANPGAAAAHTFTGLRFLTTPGSGSYVSATDVAADANVLTIDLSQSQPADGSANTLTAGGAMVNWIAPAVPLAFVQVSAGFRHSCGLVASGAAYCWGVGSALLNAFGDSTAGGRTTPGPVSGGLTFTTISAGDSHSCGLTPSGAAYCWGLNIRGSIGDGTLTNRPTPVAVAGGLQFVALEAGGHTTCALTAAGDAYCWGRNNYGEIGDGSLSDRTVPTPVSGGLTFSSISVSVDSRVCAITPAGAAYCWGHNSEGGVGDSSTTDRRTPVLVAGGLAFASLSTRSFDHTCAMTTGAQAYCWGRNADGELGDGTTTRRLTPTAVAGGQAFVSLETGTFMTCALTGAGAAYCWGANAGGQLGDGTVTGRTVPTPVTGGLTFSALRAGAGFAVALETGGAAYGWGYSYSNGRTTSSAVPVPLGPPVPPP